MSEFGWAVVGPGKIANRFADAVGQIPGARLAGIHGRDSKRAEVFARAWCKPDGTSAPVFGNLEALLGSDAVDAVYIATPHAFHADAIRRCLLAGKPVLCEKPMVANARLAGELVDLSRQRGVFLMEALWTRFLPIYATVRDWLGSNAIGELRGMQSSFCFNAPFNSGSRLFDPAQAGGSLLDLGIYNLAMTQWVLQAAHGACPEPVSINATGLLGPTGVDHRVAASLEDVATLGQLIEVEMPLQTREDVLWLLPAAIRTFQNRTFVVIQTPDGERVMDVELGLQTDDQIEILSGVQEGDVVVGP